MQKNGRNDPCHCGSGKKYKRCCLTAESNAEPREVSTERVMQIAVEHHKSGDLQQAEAGYHKVLLAQPNHPDALHFSGVIAHQMGRSDEAIALMNKAIVANPSNPVYFGNLGNLFRDQGKLDEAVSCYHKALALKSTAADVYSNLGCALRDQGKLDEALSCFHKALWLNPDLADAHNNLGATLIGQGKMADAVSCFQRALSLKSDFADAYNNLGVALMGQGKLQEAVASYHQLLTLRPDFVVGYNNLGMALSQQGKMDEACASYIKALSLKPNFAAAFSNLIFWQAYSNSPSPESQCILAAKWETMLLSEAERSAAYHRIFMNLPRNGRRLRVGVVSAELGQHAVAEFLGPLLEELDRSRLHITLYPIAVRTGPRADHFRELADDSKPLIGISDIKAAEQIRSDQIDVLIDTTSHTMGCRLGIFAHRAAPVQCHYIGHCGTTGLAEMDWFIADAALLPPSCGTHFREGIWRLPRLWISYRGDASLPESRWKPADDGTIWLGTFNNLTKVRGETCSLWARVMNALPEAKLLLKDSRAADDVVAQRIIAELASYGIERNRIEFAGWTPDWNSHMAQYDRIDVAVDTIPLNSGTTAFDALWMGVPMVVLEGDWMGGRMSSTILKALGKTEWVAHNADEYVAIVIALARDVDGRKSLRMAQRSLMADSPLCDSKSLARSLEDAFEAMFDQWLAKQTSSPRTRRAVDEN